MRHPVKLFFFLPQHLGEKEKQIEAPAFSPLLPARFKLFIRHLLLKNRLLAKQKKVRSLLRS